ncbi:hypothetical protein ABPG75_000042 [Micractinium tetrahymenae]
MPNTMHHRRHACRSRRQGTAAAATAAGCCCRRPTAAVPTAFKHLQPARQQHQQPRSTMLALQQQERAPDWPFRQQAAQLLGAATSIDFCPTAPHDYCVSAGTRMHVFDGATSAAKRQFTRFKDKAYGGSFRRDGRLIAAGGEASVVQVFDAGSRTLLRQFKGHKAPVHVARFAADNLHVLTGGDDGLVLMWDVTSGQQVSTFRGHTDYVRSAASSPASADLWATGGYDHICKLWDTRQLRCLASVDHGAPIESVAFFPSGSLLVTAGGTDICIWSMLGSGQLVQRITAHQKTATSVLVAPLAGAEPHVLSAGLDGHIKVIDPESYRPLTIHKYPAPILSLAASPAADVVAAGMADGTLSVQRRKTQGTAATEPTRLRWRPQRVAGARAHYAAPKRAIIGAQEADATVAAQPQVGVPQHEELLLKFRFTEALEAALNTQRWEVVDRVVQTLALHGALEATLAAAPPELVAEVLQHVRRQLGMPGAARYALGLADVLFNSCPPALAGEQTTLERLQQLRSAVAEELRTQEQLMVVAGMVAAVQQA